MPARGSQTYRSGGHNHTRPTSGPCGYIIPAARGVPNASQRGTKSDMAHKWPLWLHNPCCLGGPQSLQSGDENKKWPTSGPCGYITPAAWGSPTLQSGVQNQKWPTSGPCGYITLAAFRSPTLHSGGQNQKWPTSGPGGYIIPAARGSLTLQREGPNHRWPRNGPGGYITLAAWGVPERFKPGEKITNGPQVG